MKHFVTQCDISCFEALGIPIERGDNYSIARMGSSSSLMNCVYIHPKNLSGFEQTANQIIASCNATGLSHSWWIENDSESPKLTSLLGAHQIVPLVELQGMALSLPLMHGQIETDLVFATVSAIEDFEIWANIIGQAFKFTDPDAKLYASYFQKTAADGHFVHLLGKKQSRAVCTGTLLLTEQGAYLYNIATAEEERGNGYGTCMTRALLQIAEEKSCSRVGLVSSPEAASIYRNLGFRDVSQFTLCGITTLLKTPSP